jgi:hypothetical protein
MKYLVKATALILTAVCFATMAAAQTGPSGGDAVPPIQQPTQQGKLTPDHLANLLRGDRHQADIRKQQDGSHVVVANIAKEGWRFIVEFEFNSTGTNLNLICPLGNPSDQFSSAQLLQLMKKSYELPCPVHFSYRASDRRLCLEDPCYNTANLSDTAVRQLLDRMLRTVKDTHSLWDTSRWPANGAGTGNGNQQGGQGGKVEPVVQVPGDLTNSKWAGSENHTGNPTNLAFQFLAGGKVIMADVSGTTEGSWSRQGNQVTIRFSNCVYQGALQGTALAGQARWDNGKTWNFSLSLTK